jgi:hypothetical protein
LDNTSDAARRISRDHRHQIRFPLALPEMLRAGFFDAHGEAVAVRKLDNGNT